MPGGRPSKLNDEVEGKILIALRGGNYRSTACSYAGITYETFRTWMLRGQDPDDDPRYQEFRRKVEEAEAVAEIGDVAVIGKAAREMNDWRAALARLERRHPDRWGKRDRTEVQLTGSDGAPVDVRTSIGADAESIAALAATLQRRADDASDPLKAIARRTEASGVLDVTPRPTTSPAEVETSIENLEGIPTMFGDRSLDLTPPESDDV